VDANSAGIINEATCKNSWVVALRTASPIEPIPRSKDQTVDIEGTSHLTLKFLVKYELENQM
jgi:hypothetical protein